MKLKLLILLCIFSEFSYCQTSDDKNQFFILDKNWKPADIKKAVYFLHIRQKVDSNWEWTYYRIYGPRVKQECFKDEKATIKNGESSYYYPKGFINSSGRFADGQMDGDWYYWNQQGKIVSMKTFNKGSLLFDTAYKVSDDDNLKKEELLPSEAESEYPGGLPAWARFLNKNLHYPDRAIDAEAQGEVRLQFIVDSSGNIIDPQINKSVEYSLDEESLRIINLSEAWNPASKNGIHVKSYKIQPIIFSISSK